MIYTPVYTKQFSKDVKRMQKRGKNIEKLRSASHCFGFGGEKLDRTR